MAASTVVLTDWKAVLADIRNKKAPQTFTKMDASQWDPGMSRSIPVVFRNKQYNSSSAALEAYIWEHEGKTAKKFSGNSVDVMDLLAPKVLHGLRNRSHFINSQQGYSTDQSSTLDNFIEETELRISRKPGLTFGSGQHNNMTQHEIPNFSAGDPILKVGSPSPDLLITSDSYANSTKSVPNVQSQTEGRHWTTPSEPHSINSDLHVTKPRVFAGPHPSDSLADYISKMEHLHPKIPTTVSAVAGHRQKDIENMFHSQGQNKSTQDQYLAHIYSNPNIGVDNKNNSEVSRLINSQGQMSLGDLEASRSCRTQRNAPNSNMLQTSDKMQSHSDYSYGNNRSRGPPSWIDQIDQSDGTSITSDPPREYSRQRVNAFLRDRANVSSRSHDKLQRASDYLPKPKITVFDKKTNGARINLGDPQAHSSRQSTPAKSKLPGYENGRKQLPVSRMTSDKVDPTYSETILNGAAEETGSVASLPQNELSSNIVPKKRVNFTQQSELSQTNSRNTTADIVPNDPRKALTLSGCDFASSSIEHCAKYRDFADQLLEEVEETPSSVVTILPVDQTARRVMVTHRESLPTVETKSSHMLLQRDSSAGRTCDVATSTTRESSPGTEELLEPQTLIRSDTRLDSLQHVQLGQGDQGELTADPSYFAQVQQLLNTPTLQRHLEGLDLSLVHSPDTDSVLDGDRSWEQYLPVKPPVFMGCEEPPSNGDQGLEYSYIRKANRIVDQFKRDCITEAEADRNKMENGDDDEGGTESLAKAMQHLSKLKSLMRKDKKT